MDLPIIAMLTSMGSLLLTAVGVYKAVRLAPKEIRQADVDLISKYASATGAAIDQLKAVLDRLQKVTGEVSECAELIDQLYDGISILIEQIERLGSKPKWRPPSRSLKEEPVA